MKRKSRENQAPLQKDADSLNQRKRFFTVAAVFLLISTVFTIMLGVTQCKGPSTSDDDRGLDVRTETVVGERGRIFDRNGVLLVGNSNQYDLIFEYGSMAYYSNEVNAALLDCVEILYTTNNASKRATDYFPLQGTYPNLTFTADAKDKNTNVGYYYNRFLVKNELDQDITVEDFLEHFSKKHKLSNKKYTNNQMTELIRIYYDMDRIGFGAYQAYTIATGFDSSVENDLQFITRIKEKRIEGATVIQRRERVYYHEGYATHILGAIGKITAENVDDYKDYPLDALVGISGVEYAFEEYLRGTNGKLVSKYDKEGNLVDQYYDPVPVVGNDIYLTIDINLQIAAEDSLAEEIERLEDAEYGAATASDPNTGEVLVLASYPTYDISPFNRALNGLYAPGSTYKVGAALAALEKGHISSSSTHVCNQVYPYLGGPTCLGNHGTIGVSDAIRVSCNVFFYYVGHEMGIEAITPYTQKLGLGAPTGIELGEKIGTVASEAYAEKYELSWSEFDDATGAIGQSKHTYTPMQLSVYMSSIVNRGTRYSAHLLKSVKTRAGNTVFEKTPEVIETLEFSDNTYDTLMSAMHSVVSTNDTLSSYFSDVTVSAGGKTGTAEKQGTVDNALFSGFAPVNEPKIVASCVIEEGEAGSNAAKIVADIFKEYFNPAPKEEDTSTEEAEE